MFLSKANHNLLKLICQNQTTIYQTYVPSKTYVPLKIFCWNLRALKNLRAFKDFCWNLRALEDLPTSEIIRMEGDAEENRFISWRSRIFFNYDAVTSMIMVDICNPVASIWCKIYAAGKKIQHYFFVHLNLWSFFRLARYFLKQLKILAQRI